MDDEDSFTINLLDLFWGNQVSHAHGLPAGLPLPQHRMHGGQKGTDVTLLTLDPVQNLGHTHIRQKNLPATPRLGTIMNRNNFTLALL